MRRTVMEGTLQEGTGLSSDGWVLRGIRNGGNERRRANRSWGQAGAVRRDNSLTGKMNPQALGWNKKWGNGIKFEHCYWDFHAVYGLAFLLDLFAGRNRWCDINWCDWWLVCIASLICQSYSIYGVTMDQCERMTVYSCYDNFKNRILICHALLLVFCLLVIHGLMYQLS